jgi:hypothetical protein
MQRPFASSRPARRRASLAASAVSALATIVASGGCSWSTFTNFQSDTDTFAITSNALGQQLGISSRTSSSLLATGGKQGEGYTFYELLDGTADPSGSPRYANPYCVITTDSLASESPCIMPTTTAPVGTVSYIDPITGQPTQHFNCFALGYGRPSNENATSHHGVWVYCDDAQSYILTIPVGASVLDKTWQTFDMTTLNALRISLAGFIPRGTASGGALAAPQPLAFGDPTDEAAFVYPFIDVNVVPLQLPHAPIMGEGYGSQVAVGNGGADNSDFVKLYAVGATTSGKIYVYRSPGGQITHTPDHVACITGPGTGLGSVMAWGALDGDGIDDLAATGIEGGAPVVRIYLGKQLPTTPLTSECSATWQPATVGTTAWSFSCTATEGVDGCATGEFGRSIAIGDLNNDSVNDLAIGAPGVSVNGQAGAGATFLYTPNLSGTSVLDVRYRGDVQAGSGYGAALAIGKIGVVDTLAVAARGDSAAYIDWCTNLPNTPQTTRCRPQ